MAKICAYVLLEPVAATVRPRPAAGSQRQSPAQPQSVIVDCLADRERAGLAEPIREDARRAGRGGRIVVWGCDGVLCQLNCQKEKTDASQVEKQKAS